MNAINETVDCPKIKGKCVIDCIEVSYMAFNINDIFLT